MKYPHISVSQKRQVWSGLFLTHAGVVFHDARMIYWQLQAHYPLSDV